MWFSILLIISTTCLLQSVRAGNGYHYPAPFVNKLSAHTGHFFNPLSTVSPLPPVPDLPPLPTGRPHVQGIVQVHPVQNSGPTRSSVRTTNYLSPIRTPVVSTVSLISNSYQPNQGVQVKHRADIAQPGPSAGSVAPPTLPPLRIPFGKQAVINYGGLSVPGGDEQFYEINGRQLKQYAVVEIIDNDIEVPTKPFLSDSFFDPLRARIGASGIGATAFSGSPENQFQLRANTLDLERGRILDQLQPRAAAGDMINLGSGGLGYIRLSNGNVFLGSGSLGYISGQEHTQSVLDARTRSEGTVPDALHFGHGPLGSNSNFVPFK